MGPCIDNKDEALLTAGEKLIEGILTFIELRQLFNEFEIQERVVKMSEFDPPYGHWGALTPFPPESYRQRYQTHMATSNVITAAGREDVFEGINDFEKYIDTFIIILTYFSAMAACSGREWKVIMKGSEEELW